MDSYKDSDGDGVGDFKGLIEKLPYLKSLGVDVIWLSPFQPSPDMDDGYDVKDYYKVDSRLGTMADFEAFIHMAKEKKIRVVMDMVLNHTSIEHEWFAKARSDSNGTFRSRYNWAKKRPKDYNKGMAFKGEQTETWTYDEIAKAYYFHRFYDFQPDLNYRNKDVQKEAIKVLRYWSMKGINGFRLDAVPFIIDVPESGADKPAKMFGVLDSIIKGAKSVDNETLLLGEANVDPKENYNYFGKTGDRLQMMFNFYVNQYLFYALATQSPISFIDALEDTREKPDASQWAFFLRNHDEIDLGRLSKPQRNKVYEKFGPEKNMQLYDRGIRRRLAPMLNSPEQLKMAYSLLYSLPGTPVIRSGEEIGMGDDLTLKERLSVRTPMQWDTSKNSGFSSAEQTFRPVVSMGDYAFSKVNVQSESADPNSLLIFIKKLIATRKSVPEIGLGNWEIVNFRNAALFGIAYTSLDSKLIVIHNFSDQPVDLEFEAFKNTVALLNEGSSKKGIIIHFEPFGQIWLREKK